MDDRTVENDIVFITSANQKMLESYGYVNLQTWEKLPGRKIIFTEDSSIDVPDYMEVVHCTQEHIPYAFLLDPRTLPEKNNLWEGAWRYHKSRRYIWKGVGTYTAVSQKLAKYVIWVDIDVEVINPENYTKLLNINNKVLGTLIYDQGPIRHWSSVISAESGIVVFDTEHPDCTPFMQEYWDFYTSQRMWTDVSRPHDNYVLGEVSKTFDVHNFVIKESAPLDPFGSTVFGDDFTHHIGMKGKERMISRIAQNNS